MNRPLHDLLYEVYSSTLERQEFEHFKTLKVKVRNFDPIDDKYLTREYKREICLFLEVTYFQQGLRTWFETNDSCELELKSTNKDLD
ncbi:MULTISPECIES: hypothetical protein [unclassified Nostoc]|uniref:hypothetical protein n=1 Tax=unclassified Nostoc TaxID=2593658 RepID=UPI002AD3C983|nr:MULTISPECIES: hypothetical protein [unclassified Nostoc]MDZ8124239.1 hypothetical protein [Nostoc sp. CmiVER01]MDZ8224106.1 hypothetical protein [Nostoc sp. ChiVER01]